MNNHVSDSDNATGIVIPSDVIDGILDGKPTIARKDVDEILLQYFNGKLATVDYKPSVLEKSLKDGKPVQEWVPYSQSQHFRTLITEGDEAIKRQYRAYKQFNFKIPKSEFPDILGLIFAQKKIDLFMNWVKSKEWDGIDRLSTLHKAIGLTTSPKEGINLVSSDDDDLYCKSIIHMLTVGPIQRRHQPFVQDFVPIISGSQNAGKSTSMSGLLGNHEEWFSVILGAISPEHNGREFYRLQFGKALTELKEIDSILTKDNTGLVKALLDGKIVEFNEKNETGLRRVPLTSFLFGTTNLKQIFHDRTGNRRFLPVFMYQQIDTPNREELKNTDLFRYVNDPLYLPWHPEYAQQIMAQAYDQYQNKEMYDFYIDRTDKDNTVLRVQKVLNAYAMRELEGMDLFVGFCRSECEKNLYKSAIWTDIKTKFQTSERGNLSISDCKAIFESFKENPLRFGFEGIKSVRIGQPSLTDRGVGRGIKLLDPEICDRFTLGTSYDDDLDLE